MNKVIDFLKRYWKAGIWILGFLGLGLGAFSYLRRHVSIEKIAFPKTQYLTLSAKEEKVYEHVRIIHSYEFMEDEDQKHDKLDHEQFLNTVFYDKYNLVILTSKFIRRLYEECLDNDRIDVETLQSWSDQEVIGLIPPIYCEDADIIKTTFPDESVLYKVEYNVPFKIIGEEEGEDIDDFYE